MADFQHRRDRGIVRFSGELNLEAAVDLVETVDLLTRVYFYDLIEIQISSLGGVSTALEHYLAAHERWRAAGVRVRTRVVDRAASAAALLLSLGDERIAEPGAALVYHCFRVCSDAPVTATAAAVLFSDLADLDDRFLARLVDRALVDAGGVVTIAPAVDASDLPVLDRLTARAARDCETPPAHGARARPAARASGAPRDSREGSQGSCGDLQIPLPQRGGCVAGRRLPPSAHRPRRRPSGFARPSGVRPGSGHPRVALALPRCGRRSARGAHPPHARPRRYRLG